MSTPTPDDDVYVGVLECDVLLGDVASLKHKRAVIRPVLARLAPVGGGSHRGR